MFLEPINYPSVLSSGLVLDITDDYGPGSHGGSWGVDEARCNRTYTNRLKVQTASPTVGPIAIIQAVGAVIGSSYRFPYTTFPTENDTGSYLQTISVEVDKEANDTRQHIVTLEYAPFDVWSLLGSSDIQYGLINPLDRAYEVYWGEPAKYKKSKPEDESEPPQPYINTAGDPLIDPPEIEETRPVLFFARNESTFNDAYAEEFKDSVNSDEFLGYPPGTVKCRDISGKRYWDPDWGWFFTVTYQFEFDDDDDGYGFLKQIINMGYRYKKNGTGTPINAVDGAGNPVTDAVPLAANGDMLPQGKDIYTLFFNEFPQVEFSDLNIPDDILYVAAGLS